MGAISVSIRRARGASPLSLVEEHSLFDAGNDRERRPHREVEPCPVGLSHHEPGDHDGKCGSTSSIGCLHPSSVNSTTLATTVFLTGEVA